MKSLDLNIRLENAGKDYSLIDLTGFLDAHTVRSFEERLDEILESGHKRLAINLENLKYISSAGIGALMGVAHRLRGAGGDIVLLRPNQKVFKILDLLGFTKIFNIAQDEDEISQFFTTGSLDKEKNV